MSKLRCGLWISVCPSNLSRTSSLVVAMYGFSGSPWSIPNMVMYLVGGAVMEEVESNVTGVDPITLDTRNRARCSHS